MVSGGSGASSSGRTTKALDASPGSALVPQRPTAGILASRLATIGATLRKIRDGEERWEKDELLDVIYWWRQLLALVMGVIWGCVPVTGFYWFLTFILTNVVLTTGLFRTVLGIDEEEYGGGTELMMEGLPVSVSLFMITWITTYSSVQY